MTLATLNREKTSSKEKRGEPKMRRKTEKKKKKLSMDPLKLFPSATLMASRNLIHQKPKAINCADGTYTF